MTKQKIGLVLFWFGAVWAVLWGILGSLSVATAYRASTMEEVNQTMWALGSFWQLLWAFSPPLGILIAGGSGSCFSPGREVQQRGRSG
ncbi:hypothetical protein ACGF5M_03030 [Gemmatimonadota bacterium]